MEQPAAATPKAEETAKDVAKAEQEGKAVATAAAEDAKATASGSEQLAKDAQSQLDQALQSISDGKLDAAEKVVAALEARAGSLPAPLPDRIAQARKALDAAKVAAGAQSLLPKK